MLTAEYGGTGGLPIEPGMIVEEPDIEIGAGVSSKGKHFNLISLQTMLTLFFSYESTSSYRFCWTTWT